MTVTDPIADMLTRIRNSTMARHDSVQMPASRLKVSLAKILREEGYIKHYKVARLSPRGGRAKEDKKRKGGGDRQGVLRIYLKYGPNNESVIHGVRRVSRPGLRRYVDYRGIPRVLGGLGIAVISTSRGIMTDRGCRKLRIGGEWLCSVW